MRAAGAAPTSKPVLSATVAVAAGRAYTVAGMGPKAGLRLQVIDDRTSSPPGDALVRVIQASLRQHQVTVTFEDQMAGRPGLRQRHGLPGAAPGHGSRARGGRQRAHGHAAETDRHQHRHPGCAGQHGHLAITRLQDAAGSKIGPAGGAATGFGGTAPRPGASPVPWLVLTGLGAVLTLGGIARLRTLRWARRAAAHVR